MCPALAPMREPLLATVSTTCRGRSQDKDRQSIRHNCHQAHARQAVETFSRKYAFARSAGSGKNTNGPLFSRIAASRLLAGIAVWAVMVPEGWPTLGFRDGQADQGHPSHLM